MGQVAGRIRWRNRLLHALQLLAQASARMPYGVPEPVLCGAAAVELYTGGLWLAPEIELLAAEPRPLHVELMAVGFCWTRRPDGNRSLRHPTLQIGVNAIDDDNVLGPSARANILTVVIERDLGTPPVPPPQSVRVVGIDDVIADQAASWVGEGARPGEAAARIDVLVGLGRADISGQFRPFYSQRRLVCETQRAVTLERLPPTGGFDEAMQRTVSLSAMARILTRWHARCGVAVAAGGPEDASHLGSLADKMVLDPNDATGRAGRSSALAANVIPFEVGPRGSPRWSRAQEGLEDP